MVNPTRSEEGNEIYFNDNDPYPEGGSKVSIINSILSNDNYPLITFGSEIVSDTVIELDPEIESCFSFSYSPTLPITDK